MEMGGGVRMHRTDEGEGGIRHQRRRPQEALLRGRPPDSPYHKSEKTQQHWGESKNPGGEVCKRRS